MASLFHWKEPLTILGGGSIGLLFAASLRTALPSYPVSVLLRSHHRDRIIGNDDQTTMKLTWKKSTTTTQQPQVLDLPVQFVNDDNPIQNLIVATKAYQAKAAVTSVLDRLDSDSSMSTSRLVILCNGALSVREELTQLLDNRQQHDKKKISVLLATTTHGAYQLHNNSDNGKKELVHAGVGKTFVEDDASGWGAGLASLFHHVGLHGQCLRQEEMHQLLWKKLAANCVINPLTALFQCHNGELMMEPSFPELQYEILEEVSRVAAATLEAEQGQESTTNKENEKETLRNFVTQVIQDTHHNKSSMLQDVLQRQPTEIHHLNGYVVRKGRALGMECPVNDDICQRIATLPTATTKKH